MPCPLPPPSPPPQASPYLNKLPAKFDPEDRIIVTDPMLATGGTIIQVSPLPPCPMSPRHATPRHTMLGRVPFLPDCSSDDDSARGYSPWTLDPGVMLLSVTRCTR